MSGVAMIGEARAAAMRVLMGSVSCGCVPLRLSDVEKWDRKKVYAAARSLTEFDQAIRANKRAVPFACNHASGKPTVEEVMKWAAGREWTEGGKATALPGGSAADEKGCGGAGGWRAVDRVARPRSVAQAAKIESVIGHDPGVFGVVGGANGKVGLSAGLPGGVKEGVRPGARLQRLSREMIEAGDVAPANVGDKTRERLRALAKIIGGDEPVKLCKIREVLYQTLTKTALANDLIMLERRFVLERQRVVRKGNPTLGRGRSGAGGYEVMVRIVAARFVA